MKRSPQIVLMVSLALMLGACTQTVEKVVEKRVEVAVPSDIPAVPRVQRPATPDCGPAAPSSLANLVGGFNKIEFQNYLRTPVLKAQTDLPDTVQSMIFATKALMNSYYYGFSTVDLQALHTEYEALFRKDRPKSLALYPINNSVDQLMVKYADAPGDEHTFYLNAAQAQSYRDSFNGASTPTPVFGVSYVPVPQNDGIVILNVRGESPFYRAGLRRGDVISKIDGQTLLRQGEADDVKLRARYAVIITAAAKKSGPATPGIGQANGPAVPIEYSRAGVVQSAISLNAQFLPALTLPWGELRTDAEGKKNFYLRIPTFSGTQIADTVHALVTKAKTENAQSIVVDLRDNGGGRLVEFVGAAAAFSPSNAGEILEDLTANDIIFTFDGQNIIGTDTCTEKVGKPSDRYIQPILNPVVWTGKTVVLTNQYSASASEIFAQVLRLGGKTRVIGEKTYGVGNTFTYNFDMPGARALSVTSGRGKLLNKVYATADVTPDELQPDDLAKLVQGNDLAYNAAIAYLSK